MFQISAMLQKPLKGQTTIPSRPCVGLPRVPHGQMGLVVSAALGPLSLLTVLTQTTAGPPAEPPHPQPEGAGLLETPWLWWSTPPTRGSPAGPFKEIP